MHSQGVVAQVAWEPVPGNPYSGVFATGYDQVLMRLSQTSNLTHLSPGLLPSLALKFLKDGVYAENILAMPNMTGIKSWNFFEQPMRTRVPAFDVDEYHFARQVPLCNLLSGGGAHVSRAADADLHGIRSDG